MNIVLSTNLLILFIELVYLFMEQCNNQLSTKLLNRRNEGIKEQTSTTVSKSRHDCLYEGIEIRLRMVTPYLRSGRWSEAMALGALPPQSLTTMQQLNQMTDIIAQHVLTTNDPSSFRNSSSPMELPVLKAAIFTIYTTTELHLLADNSDDHADTWKLLSQLVGGLDQFMHGDFSMVNDIAVGMEHVSTFNMYSNSVVPDNTQTNNKNNNNTVTLSSNLEALGYIGASLANGALSMVQPAVQGGFTTALSTLWPSSANNTTTSSSSMQGGDVSHHQVNSNDSSIAP